MLSLFVLSIPISDEVVAQKESLEQSLYSGHLEQIALLRFLLHAVWEQHYRGHSTINYVYPMMHFLEINF